MIQKRKGLALESSGFSIPAAPLTSCVTVGMPPTLSEPHLKMNKSAHPVHGILVSVK